MLKKSVPPFVARMREMAELFEAEQAGAGQAGGDPDRAFSPVLYQNGNVQPEPVGAGFRDR